MKIYAVCPERDLTRHDAPLGYFMAKNVTCYLRSPLNNILYYTSKKRAQQHVEELTRIAEKFGTGESYEIVVINVICSD